MHKADTAPSPTNRHDVQRDGIRITEHLGSEFRRLVPRA
jgi:hypothetical protein